MCWTGGRRRLSRRASAPASIVQRDASMVCARARPAIAAQGVIFTDLETAVREHPELVKRYFMTKAVPADFGKFEALHAAFWQGGAFLYVPKGVTVELPFRSFAVASGAGRRDLHAHAGRARRGRRSVFRRFLSIRNAGRGRSFASAVVELIVGEGRANCATSRCRTGAATSGTS